MRTLPFVSIRAMSIALFAVAPTADAQQIKATPIATGLSSPICTRAAPGDVRRIFVVGRAGRISVIKDGVLLATPFVDIQSSVGVVGEGGLLGLAFHPDYAANGRFFVSFTDTTGANVVVREYRASANPDVADPTSMVPVFGPYPHSGAIHYGGDLAFGGDGKLYYSIGAAGFADPQSSTSYLGKILRLDVDVPAPHVPADNPYASPTDGVLDLIWARGVRNPWRFSFDRLTGDLYIGDVGGGSREEIDFQPATFGLPGSPAYGGGRNWGWPCMEGNLCAGGGGCVCDLTGATLDLPVWDLAHTSGVSALVGGFVYRGSAIAGLQGTYFCGDYSSGRVWSFKVVNGQATQVLERTAELAGMGGFSSFGEDANGEIYVSGLFAGKISRIDPVATPCATPQTFCPTTPNSVGSGARIGSAGSASLASNELVLTATNCPRNKSGAFFHGASQSTIPFANGLRCVDGVLVRTSIVQTDEHGFAHRPFDAVAAGMTAGQTRHFQFYFRDPAAGGSNADLSDGLSVSFCP